MKRFSPHLEILPAPQRAFWNELSEVSGEFVLYGGTALALHLAHRKSVDFDLFGSRALDLAQIERGVSFLKGANIIQRDKNTLSAIVDRGGPVRVSFFGLPNLPRLSAPAVAEDNGLGIASLLDLAGTKASVVQVRAESKDYIDIDALITKGKVTLPFALSAAHRLYGSTFNPQITLKALSFFDDGDLAILSEETKSRLATAAREVDLDHLPRIEIFSHQIDRDRGYEL